MKKRILSILLALALCAGWMPMHVMAVIRIPEPEPEVWDGGFLVKNGHTLVGYEGEGGDIVIPDGITELKDLVFQCHDEITSVVIPDGVTKIPRQAFCGCKNLTSVTLPDSVTYIDGDAFSESGLTGIVIPDSVKAITSSFCNCKDLKTVSLGRGLTEITAYAFQGSGLTEVVIPDNVTSIETRAFAFCDKLTAITIPSSVRKIDYDAFAQYWNDNSIAPWNDILTIRCEAGSAAAAHAQRYPTLVVVGTFDADGTFTPAPEEDPPETPEPEPESDFLITDGVLIRYQGTATDVVIPDGVTSIKNSAFSGGELNVLSVTLPDSITTIEEHAFFCKTLQRVKIGNGLTKIENYAFMGCANLRQVEFGNSVTEIGTYAFCRCSSLEEIVFPNSLKTIGSSAFFECSELSHVELGNGVTTIEAHAFRNCDSLTEIVIPDNVTKLGHQVFYRTFNNTATIYIKGSRGGAAEAYIQSTWINGDTEIFVPGTFVNGAFVPDKVENPDPTPTPGTGTGSGSGTTVSPEPEEPADTWGNPYFIIDKNGVLVDLVRSSIAVWNAEEYIVPDGVVEIAPNAFADCRAWKIVIPASVKKIGECAFKNSYHLRELHIKNPNCKLGKDFLKDCNYLRSYYLGSEEIERPEWVEYQLWQAENRHDYWINEMKNDKNYKENLAANKQYLETIEEYDYRYVPISHDVYQLSNQICRGLNNDRDRLLALYRWVTDNIYYDRDNTFELGVNKTPNAQRVLDDKKYVCRGFSSLFQGLCAAQDIPCVIASGEGRGEGHEWNVVQVNGKWLWADTTLDCENKYENGEWVPGTGDFTYFLCSTEFISVEHIADYSAHEGNLDTSKSNGNNAAKAAKNNTSLSAWALTEVQNALCTGLVPYEIQSRYNSDITREEFCELMVQMVTKHTGKDIDTYLAKQGLKRTNPFTDTKNSDVVAAYALGIVKGTSDTTFNPGGHITRQEAATMLARTGRLLGIKAKSPVTFVDRDTFADWSTDSIDFTSSLKDPFNNKSVMEGTGGGNFSPLASYSREQAIITALRLFSAADNHTVRTSV